MCTNTEGNGLYVSSFTTHMHNSRCRKRASLLCGRRWGVKASSYRIDGFWQCLQNEIMCHSVPTHYTVYERKLRSIREHDRPQGKPKDKWKTGLGELGSEINASLRSLNSRWLEESKSFHCFRLTFPLTVRFQTKNSQKSGGHACIHNYACICSHTNTEKAKTLHVSTYCTGLLKSCQFISRSVDSKRQYCSGSSMIIIVY